MARLSVFNNASLDGYFTDAEGDMSWAYAGGDDPEWQAFVAGNAGSGGALLLGRITYDMMAGFWPTPAAAASMPAVAVGMNRMRKYVASRTMRDAAWANTTVLEGALPNAVRDLKAASADDIVILGSGSIVAQLMAARLIDGIQVVINPIVLGSGRTMFAGLPEAVHLKLVRSRSFANGKLVLDYEAA